MKPTESQDLLSCELVLRALSALPVAPERSAMPFVDYAKREINFKIVYYGPGFVGKVTNMQFIYERAKPELRSKLSSFATETERTMFFDFRPQTLGDVKGVGIRLHLYTVPGPVFSDVAHVNVLEGVDGIIFVADSQKSREDADVESLANLQANLVLNGRSLDDVPMVLQYNKRDLPDILSVAELDEMLNPGGRARFEAIAFKGVGVFDTLRAIAEQVVHRVSAG
jgi:signal recognition particle receptor subunit beta